MKVAVGQVWKHKPSGDVRTVLAVVTYRERVGLDPTEFERLCGITHIAVMSTTDRRDSSDMPLVRGCPFSSASWESVTPSGSEGDHG